MRVRPVLVPLLVFAAVATVAAVVAACGGAGDDRAGVPTTPGRASMETTTTTAAMISASGNVFAFAIEGGMVAGAEVRVLELPNLRTITAEDGSWRIDGLPAASRVTFVMDGGDRPAIQTATFRLGEGDLEQVSFQSPNREIYDLMAELSGVEPDPRLCQIASTVTRRGHSLYDRAGGTHGEPGATVTIDPPLPPEAGPIYFNLIEYNVIYPDRALDATTDDGGVLFLNVEPGEYVLRAHKDGATIDEVLVSCRAGVLTNASPPWGLQVRKGGLDPDPERAADPEA